MNVCSIKPRLVTLHDGTEVLSDSEAWRAECEARAVLRIFGRTTKETHNRRRAYILLVRRGDADRRIKGRGDAAADALEALVIKIWEAERRQEDGAAS